MAIPLHNATASHLAMSPTEHQLALMWAEILQSTSLATPCDNFFHLGGRSVDMVMLLFRIQEKFAVDLDNAAVFQAPTLRELATLVDKARAVAAPT